MTRQDVDIEQALASRNLTNLLQNMKGPTAMMKDKPLKLKITGIEETPKPAPSPSNESQPLNAPQNQTVNPESESASGFDTSHFEGLEKEYTQPEIETPAGVPSKEIMTQDAFFALFCALHSLPNQLGPALGAGHIFPLQALPVHPHEMEPARGASDAMYDTIAEIPALHFLLDVSGKWMQRASLIGGYAFMKFAACKGELQARYQHPMDEETDESMEGFDNGEI